MVEGMCQQMVEYNLQMNTILFELFGLKLVNNHVEDEK